MQHDEALRHIRTLINVAAASDDIELIYKHLRMMRRIVNDALPVGYRRKRSVKKARKPALKVVK